MNTSLVLTLTGLDKPGLVRAVAAVVSAHDANWEESRMAHLAGRFAGILQVSVPEGRIDALIESLEKLDEQGLSVRAERGACRQVAHDCVAMRLEVVGNDRAGIVRELSDVLAASHVNVEELNTQRMSAPHDGTMLFVADAKLLAPPRLDVEELRARLESLANDLMVELSLDRVEDASD